MSPIYAANLQMSRTTGTVPERVQSRVHTTEPTGPVPEPFHCDQIARWSARSGTTGRSGTGLNTGDWNGSGTVPVPNLWCEHGLIPRLHYQPVSSRFSSCALTSPVSTSVCVYITTARTGLNQRQLVRLFHSTVAGSRAVPKHVRACR